MKGPDFALHVSCSVILALGLAAATHSLSLQDKRIAECEESLVRMNARVALIEHAPGRGR